MIALDVDQVIEIIECSDLEDVLIINENYENILNNFVDDEDLDRVSRLKDRVQQRIKKIKNEY